MIVFRSAGGLLLVAQPDHGVVAGALARAWGNPVFAAPSPPVLLYTAEHHDDAWLELDAVPVLNPALGRPHTFISMPITARVAHYRKGIDVAEAHDPYAGLLTSLHYVGLMQGFYGLYGQEPVRRSEQFRRSLPAEQRRAIQWFKQGESRRRKRLWPAAPGADWERRLWENYRMLQVWDVLSLFLCRHRFPGQGDVVRLPGAPAHPGGADVVLTAVWLDGERVALSPYPLATPELALRVLARRIPDREYGSDDELQAVWAAAEPVDLGVCVVPGSPAVAPAGEMDARAATRVQ